MSIYNINTYYSGNDYGDYSNGTQTYTDYSVNEINGPCNVQRYTINNNSTQIYPNGYTKFAIYTITGSDYQILYSDVTPYLLQNGFNKDGQTMTVINSIESTNAIQVTIPGPVVIPINIGQAITFIYMSKSNGDPSVYVLRGFNY
jgi:hypothetical protein